MTDDVSAAEPLLNRAQLAQIFDVSENTIDKWRGKGMPVEVEGGNGVAYGFNYSACLAWHDGAQAQAASERKAADGFIAQKRMEFLGLQKDDKKAGLNAAEMRALAQAELVWMQAAKARGSLIQVDDVVELLDAVFTELRAGLDGMPDWLEREFELSGEDVEKAVAYNDEILKTIKEKIAQAALYDPAPVIDPIDKGFI